MGDPHRVICLVRKVASTVMGHKSLKSFSPLFLPGVRMFPPQEHSTKSAFPRPVAKPSQLVSSANSRPKLQASLAEWRAGTSVPTAGAGSAVPFNAVHHFHLTKLTGYYPSSSGRLYIMVSFLLINDTVKPSERYDTSFAT